LLVGHFFVLYGGGGRRGGDRGGAVYTNSIYTNILQIFDKNINVNNLQTYNAYDASQKHEMKFQTIGKTHSAAVKGQTITKIEMLENLLFLH